MKGSAEQGIARGGKIPRQATEGGLGETGAGHRARSRSLDHGFTVVADALGASSRNGERDMELVIAGRRGWPQRGMEVSPAGAR